MRNSGRYDKPVSRRVDSVDRLDQAPCTSALSISATEAGKVANCAELGER